jgi:hypothetical protein
MFSFYDILREVPLERKTFLTRDIPGRSMAKSRQAARVRTSFWGNTRDAMIGFANTLEMK